MKLFGKPKEGPKEALKKLEEQLEVLNKRQVFLEKKMQDEIAQAKKYQKMGSKKAAIMCMKRKRIYQKQFDQTQGAVETLTQQVLSIQSAQVNKETLEAMARGAKAQRQALGKMTVDQVDNLMLDVEEANELSDAVAVAMAQGVGGQQFDEDELLEELKGYMEEEELSTWLPQVPHAAPKPKAKVAVDDDAEFAALEAEMLVA